MNKRIIFTGGGTAGHVTLNLQLIPRLQKEGWDVAYIGSYQGIEKELVEARGNVAYYGIATGKLRRYFDWKNVSDPFRVLKGVMQARKVIKRLQPQLIFSKGGFVSVPVIVAGWLQRVPIVIHESDLTPGLANRLALPFVTKVCTTFPETSQHLPAGKVEYVGALVREDLQAGDATRGRHYCGFTAEKPVLLVMGGSQGSQRINQLVRASLSQLLLHYHVIHICGKGQLDPALAVKGYCQLEYVGAELPDLLALAELVVSRAGANTLFELLALRKPMLLLPLPKGASRGDQIVNAEKFKRLGYAEVLQEEELNQTTFLAGIEKVWQERDELKRQMEQTELLGSMERLLTLILKQCK